MNDEKKKFIKSMRLLGTQSENSKDISHIFDDYDNLVEHSSESKLVPNSGSCTGIEDENEIIDKIQKIIDERIIPEKIISVEEYLLKLKIIFTKALALEKSALAMHVFDSFTAQNIIITERLLPLLSEEILKFGKTKKIIKRDVGSFQFVDVDIPKLVQYLTDEKKYFNGKDSIQLKTLFNGSQIDNPVNCDVKINLFVSLIYQFKEAKKIINSKKYLHNWIYSNFLFEGNKTTLYYLEKISKPNGENRISKFDKKNFIDIEQFITSI